ncbi:MAG: ATP-dependent RecD-like DNA helicase, partial [Clostridia bacterium]
YRVGDKIMQNKNNYDMTWVKTKGGYEEGTGVFNGDMGTLIAIDVFASKVQVYFDDDREAWYDYDKMDELDLAYAVTVHKSQGCEFPVVVMPMCKVHTILMTRNLLYTAVTRAKQMVVLVGETCWLEHMVRNNREMFRFSALAERISAYWSRWHDGIES